MTLLLGTVDVVDVRFGAATVSKVMLGTAQVWPSGPLTPTGTINVVEAADVAAIVGTVTAAPVTGTIAATDSDDTAAIAGTFTVAPVVGTIAATDADDTAAIAGGFAAAGSFLGAIAATEADDIAAIAGTVATPTYTGTIAATDADDTAAIVGTTDAPVFTGTIAATDADDVATVVGTSAAPIYSGTIGAVEDDDVAAIAGTTDAPVFTGIIGAVEDGDASTITATFGPTGVVGITEEVDASVITGTSVQFVGAVAVIEADDTSTIAGTFTAPAFPTIAAVNNEVGTSMGAQAINMPTGITAGDLLVAIAANDSPTAAMTASAGWTEIRQQVQGANVMRLAAFGRIADGTATDNITITGAAQDYVAWTARITGHAVSGVSAIFAADATGATGNGDPPNLATDSDRGWLWLAAEGVDLTTGNTVTSVPSGYTSQVNTVSASSTSSVALAVGSRTAAGVSTENPATFTNNPTTRPWVAFTIGIPAVAPATVTGTIAATEAADTSTITGSGGAATGFAKYRTFNGSTDYTTWTLGNLAGVSANPQTLVAVVRLTNGFADAVVIASPGFTPVDWFYNDGAVHQAQLYDGTDIVTGQAWDVPDGWCLLAVRSLSAAPAKTSKSAVGTSGGSTFPTPTHLTSPITLGAKSFSSTGLIGIGAGPAGEAPMPGDIVCIARFDTALSDAQINNMINGVTAIQGTPGITNLWMLGQTTPADLVGTSTLNALTGSTLSSGDSPFPT